MIGVEIAAPGGPEVLIAKGVADPEPTTGQIVVRVAAAGVNFIDTYHRSGLYPQPMPLIVGSEGAGTVEALGEGVTGIAVGDRVAWAMAMGSYAQLIALPASSVVPVPDAIALDVAAASMLQGMTAHYLTHTTYPLRAGDTALVHAGAGGTGLLITQMAKALGATVITTVSTPAKAELSREAGADHVIVASHDLVSEVRELTQGDGVHVVFDGVGAATFDDSLACLRLRGTMVLFGGSSGPVPPFDPQILNTMGSLHLTRPSLIHHLGGTEYAERAAAVFAGIQSGDLRIHIGGRYPLADAATAHTDLESRATTGKLLLIP